MTPQPKEYWEAIEDFMRSIDNMKVDSLVMVALISEKDESDAHDIVAAYHAGPFELMSVASTLQLHAGYMFNHINDSEEEGVDDGSEETDK